ncbi:MAG: hypothetical protein O2905_02985 [Proteobacteria bacterium]|nr:hypothetical protein [Pseudomonadota bacterium]
MKRPPDGKDRRAERPKEATRERLSRALRDNLKRRKGQDHADRGAAPRSTLLKPRG